MTAVLYNVKTAPRNRAVKCAMCGAKCIIKLCLKGKFNILGIKLIRFLVSRRRED